jgi:hypothetical protein
VVQRKTALFKEVNESMSQLLIQFRAEEQAAFFCECPVRDCVRRVALTQTEYEGVRRTGGFLVSPDCRRWSGVLLQTSRYVVVKDFRVVLERVPEPSRSEASRSEASRSEASRSEEPADPGPRRAALLAATAW